MNRLAPPLGASRMHFHLPKPLHGWREFAGEVGVIVLGVLIALAAGQIVEDWRWTQRANDAQRSIAHELAENAGVLDERKIVAPCLNQQLAQVARIIDDARKTGRIGNVKGVLFPVIRPILTTGWDSAVADDTATHLHPERRQSYAEIYTMLSDYRRQLDEEGRLWTHVYLLQGRPGQISDSMLTEIANDATELGYRNWQDTTIAAQQLDLIRAAGIRPDYYQVLDRAGSHAEVLRQARLARMAPPNCLAIQVDGKPVPLDAPPL